MAASSASRWRLSSFRMPTVSIGLEL
jgi:hypothetical protein